MCKVQGKLGIHKVFVQGASGACGCKAYINEGACVILETPAVQVFSGSKPPPTTQSTATASASDGSLTEPVSEGSGKPPDAGDPALSVRDVPPGSRSRVSSVSRGKGLSIDPDGLEACRAKFLDGSGFLEETLRVVRSDRLGQRVLI